MSPVVLVLAVACVLLATLVGVLAVTVRRADREAKAHEHALAGLRAEVAELAARQHEREPTQPAAADYVIAFDEQPVPTQPSTQRVVSATLGEPLIKVAALGHGVRRALREERRAHLAYQVRREYRRRRRASRVAQRRRGR
ncbi:MAG: hypothetical protein GEU96_17565 [Propionibacteriales bacterium]|nr:hypothetical protein [Propionibacteriales bacterium]